ncbi:MAG: anti-sigma factor domain-containing protein [Rudaea sp.]
MSVHDEVQDLIPAYVLGALDPPEAARARAHLAGCAECTGVLREYQETADSLALGVPLAKLPPDLKSRTLEKAIGEGQPREEMGLIPTARRAWPHLGGAQLIAGAALVITLLTLAWSVWQSTQFSQQLALQRDFVTVLAYAEGSALSVRGTALAPQAEGKLYVDRDSNVAALITVQLPPLKPGQIYQLWLTQAGGQYKSGGTFTVDSSGDGWLLVRAPSRLGEYARVEITVEPSGGSAAPTTQPLLSAALAGS